MAEPSGRTAPRGQRTSGGSVAAQVDSTASAVRTAITAARRTTHPREPLNIMWSEERLHRVTERGAGPRVGHRPSPVPGPRSAWRDHDLERRTGGGVFPVLATGTVIDPRLPGASSPGRPSPTLEAVRRPGCRRSRRLRFGERAACQTSSSSTTAGPWIRTSRKATILARSGGLDPRPLARHHLVHVLSPPGEGGAGLRPAPNRVTSWRSSRGSRGVGSEGSARRSPNRGRDRRRAASSRSPSRRPGPGSDHPGRTRRRRGWRGRHP